MVVNKLCLKKCIWLKVYLPLLTTIVVLVFTYIWSLTRTAALFLFPLNFAKSMTFVVDCCTFQPKQKCAHFKCSLHDLSKLMIKHPIFLLIWFQGSKMKYYFSCWSSWYRSLHIFGGEQSSLKLKLFLFFNPIWGWVENMR